MKIDIQPKVERATGIDLIAIDHMNAGPTYVVRTANNEDYTVHFCEDSLDKFQPRRTVSEMMEIWEEGLKRQLKEAEKVVKTGNHPTWTNSVWDGDKLIGYEPYKLSDTTIYQKKIVELKKKIGKMKFVMLVGSDIKIENSNLLMSKRS